MAIDLENINEKEIIKKVIHFLNENENKEITTQLIKSSFSVSEIIYILNYNSNEIIDFFGKKIKINELFSSEEIRQLIEDNIIKIRTKNINFFINYLEPDLIMSLLDKQKISESVKNMILNKSLDRLSDLQKEKLFLTFAHEELKEKIFKSFTDDKLKIKYLKVFPKEDRKYLIRFIKDDKIKLMFLNFISPYKVGIISSLSNDKLKMYYLKKYWSILSANDIAQIIGSLESYENVLSYISFFNNDYKKACLIKYVKKHFDKQYIFELAKTINSEECIMDCISCFNEEQQLELIEKVNAESIILDNYGVLSKKIRLHLLNKLREKNIIKLLESEEITENHEKIIALSKLSNVTTIESYIEHMDLFPQYDDEYEGLIEIYSNHYKLNKEHLLKLTKTFNLSILRMIKNQNVKNIINSEEDTFNKIIGMFSKENFSMENQSLNDILNMLLQRIFKLKKGDVITIFSRILASIQNSDNKKANELLNTVFEKIDISKYLDKYNYKKDEFIRKILNNEEKAIQCLNEITTAYVVFERNKFTQGNIGEKRDLITKLIFEKKSFSKYFIYNYPTEFILSLFDQKTKNISMYLDEIEVSLIKNKDLLKKIIQYRKNPKLYQPIPEDIKNNLKIFNNVLDKLLIPYLSDFDLPYTENIKRENLIVENFNKNLYDFSNVLANLDIEKLKLGVLSDQNLYEQLLKYINKYKLFSWNKKFSLILNEAGIILDEQIIANLIQYFPVIYGQLKSKVDSGQLTSITLPSIIDYASVFSSYSSKYSLLFGKSDFSLISGNPGPNSAPEISRDERINKAIELISVIRNREYVTVPTIDKDFQLKNNKKINIVVGNFSNMMNLTYGERTGACMRIGGAGSSLYDFCLKNENGFHIRFTNPNTGKFVSRVSGFRNGNTVFLNQLRFSVDSTYTDEDIEEACKLIAQELIDLSKNSLSPIDNVVISKSHVMSKSQTLNLRVSNIKSGIGNFYSDVNDNAVILASSNKDNSLVPVKLGNSGVQKYPVQRDKKKIYSKDQSSFAKNDIIQIHMIDKILDGEKIEEIDVIELSNFLHLNLEDEQISDNIVACYVGEDWYVYVDTDYKIHSFIMKNTKQKAEAIKEMEEALVVIKANLSNVVTLEETGKKIR